MSPLLSLSLSYFVARFCFAFKLLANPSWLYFGNCTFQVDLRRAPRKGHNYEKSHLSQRVSYGLPVNWAINVSDEGSKRSQFCDRLKVNPQKGKRSGRSHLRNGFPNRADMAWHLTPDEASVDDSVEAPPKGQGEGPHCRSKVSELSDGPVHSASSVYGWA